MGTQSQVTPMPFTNNGDGISQSNDALKSSESYLEPIVNAALEVALQCTVSKVEGERKQP
jgi:hypothetical protein